MATFNRAGRAWTAAPKKNAPETGAFRSAVQPKKAYLPPLVDEAGSVVVLLELLVVVVLA